MAFDSRSAERNGSAEGAEEAEPKRFSLRIILVVLFVAAFLPAGVLAVVQSLSAYSDSTRAMERDLSFQLRAAVRAEETIFYEARGALALAARELAVVSGDPERCVAALDRLAAVDERYLAADFTAAGGGADCVSSVGAKNGDTGRHIGFERFLEDPEFRVTAIDSYIRGQSRVVAAYPVRQGERLLGAVSVSFKPTLMDRLRQRLRDDGEVAILSLDTDTPAWVRVRGGAEEQRWRPADDLLNRLVLFTPRELRGVSQEGEAYIYAAVRIGGSGLIALAAWPSDEQSRTPETRVLLGVGLPLAAWLLAVGVVVVALRYLVIRQLARLTESTTQLRAGNRKVRTTFSEAAPLEFHELGVEFDEMAAKINDREARLEAALSEQRLLLKEVYHRVKNNLQLIVSLLNMQLRAAKTDTEREIVRTTQNRVHTLALVHQNLYSVGQLGDVRLDVLLQDLAPSLRALRTEDAGALKIQLALDAVTMDAEHAAPASLFATEAIINAIKHTPFGTQDATVTVTLRTHGENGFRLSVANPIDGAVEADGAPKSVGMRLMSGFARQLGGVTERTAHRNEYKVTLTVQDVTPTAKRYSASVDEKELLE